MRQSRMAGLDIGTSAVRAVEATLDAGGVRVSRYAQVPLPPGTVAAGEVHDPLGLTDAVKQLWRTGGFKSKRVTMSVANRRVVVRQVDLPWVAPSELRDALYFQAQDLLPIPIEESVLDHHPLEEYMGDAGAKMLRLMLVAADARMVGRAVEAVREAGLRPSVVDLTPFAVLRGMSALLSSGGVGAETTEALIDVGSSVTNIVIHTGGRPRFVRILMLGGADVTDALSEHLGVSFDDAEARKCDVQPDDETGESSARAVESAAQMLLDEVRGSLDYYRAQPGAVPLTRVVLSGGGSRLGPLAGWLSSVTHLPVHDVAALSSVTLPTQRGADAADQFEPTIPVVGIGLALRGAA